MKTTTKKHACVMKQIPQTLPLLSLSVENLKLESVDGRYDENDPPKRQRRVRPYPRPAQPNQPSQPSQPNRPSAPNMFSPAVQRMINQIRLRSGVGTYPKEYLKLLDDIKENLPIRFASTGLRGSAVTVIQQFLEETDDLTKVFEPSYAGRYASVSKKPIDTRIAKQLTVAFFDAKSRVMGQDYFNNRMWATEFKTRNETLIKTFARDSIESFLALPDSNQRPLLDFNLTINLQEVNASKTYMPIVKEIHMDGEQDIFKPRGERYGRPVEEQDVSSFVSSFCANLYTGPDGVKKAMLDQCGTVIFDGLPIVKPDVMLMLAERLSRDEYGKTLTEYELISALSEIFAGGSVEALRKYNETALRQMGITTRETEMLKWTNANALAFHRSVLLNEVVANALMKPDGTYFPRMRGFFALLTDTGGDDGALGRGNTDPIEFTYSFQGRNIPVKVFLNLSSS